MLTNLGYAFSVHRTDGYCVVRASGELDIASVGAMGACVRQARRHAGPIVVDLRDVTFMDTFALRALLALQLESDDTGGGDGGPGGGMEGVRDLAGLRDGRR